MRPDLFVSQMSVQGNKVEDPNADTEAEQVKAKDFTESVFKWTGLQSGKRRQSNKKTNPEGWGRQQVKTQVAQAQVAAT